MTVQEEEQPYRDRAAKLNLSIPDILEIVTREYLTYYTPTGRLKKGVWLAPDKAERICKDYFIVANIQQGCTPSNK